MQCVEGLPGDVVEVRFTDAVSGSVALEVPILLPAGYEDAPPLPDTLADDGKSYVNPPRAELSSAYHAFVEPLDNGRRGGL